MTLLSEKKCADSAVAVDYFKFDDLYSIDMSEVVTVPQAAPRSSASVTGMRMRWSKLSISAFEAIPSDTIEGKYAELFAALDHMRSLDEDESLFIDADTYRSACSILSLLSYSRATPPKVYSHGGDAVVFTWRMHNESYQLTVSNGTAALGKSSVDQGVVLLGHVDLATQSIHGFIPFFQVRSDRTGTNATRR